MFELGQGSRGRTGVVLAALLALALVLTLPAAASATPCDASTSCVVNSTGDEVDAEPGDEKCETAISKKCTLRAAIEESNELGSEKPIKFNGTLFNGKVAGTIALGSSLPSIESSFDIDGDGGGQCTTEAPGVKGPCVGLSGPASGAALTVEAPEVEIEGLAVTGAKVGIDVGGFPTFKATDNWFGVKLDGKEAGNTTGLLLDTETFEATIGGTKPALRNVFASNSVDGLDVRGASEVVIQGNYFGVKPDGKTQASNNKDIEVTDSGIFESSGIEIGANIPAKELATPECDGACNVISGATASGVDLQGDEGEEAPATGPTTIAGNYIGLNAAGTELVGNGASGILAGAAEQVAIGGAEAGEANHIAGGKFGVYSKEGDGLHVEGNSIGFNATGGAVVPPSKDGVFASSPGAFEPPVIYGNSIRTVGTGIGIEQQFGGAMIEKNVVKGGQTGILVSEESAGLESFIEGNRIEGALANGILIESDLNQVFGNEVLMSGKAGIRVKQAGTVTSTNENFVGGETAASENVISGSGGPAVEISDLEGTANEVARNRGSGNSGLFIDLVATDPVKEPNGPNNGIKPPVISAAKQSEASGSAHAGATVRVFRKATTSSGEIASFLGQAVADGSGNWTVAYTAVPDETQIAVSQTDAEATSELSFAKTEPAPKGKEEGPPDVEPPTLPETKILKAPKAKTHSKTAKFTFSSSAEEPTFQCKLDGKPFKACESPVKYKKLKPGKHVFKVRAIDEEGNVDPTPATAKFKILR